MDLKLNKQSAMTKEVLLDSSYEHPFEVDCTLPDYCRDIVKILNTTVVPSVRSATVNGNKLTIDGNNHICVYYTDNEEHLSKYESKLPFSKVIELKSAPQSPSIEVDCTEGYINCRAVSPRRLDIRGTVCLLVTVCDNREEAVVNGIDCDDMEVKPCICETAHIVAQQTKQFTVKENLSLIKSKRKVERIVRYQVVPVLEEYKLLPNKVIVKGQLFVHCSYCAEGTKSIEIAEYTLPFSQIIDCSKVDEDCICDIHFLVNNCELSCSHSEENDCSFQLEATICANVTCYKNFTVTAIEDCYCKRYGCTSKCRNLNLSKLVEIHQHTHVQKDLVEVPPDTTEVVDAWCKYVGKQISSVDEKITVEVKAIICLMVLCDNHYQCVEKPITIPYSFALSADIKQISFAPHICIVKTSASEIANCKSEVTCSLQISGAIVENVRCCVVDQVEIDTSVEKENKRDQVVVYYPSIQENLWQIAKKFNTSVDLIRAENNLEEDLYVDSSQILLITPR